MPKHTLQIHTIEQKILHVRGHKVMLDHDLANLYDVPTKTLKRAVKRNLDRFPIDFMFELTRQEYNSLRYQFGTLEDGRGKYAKYVPFAFTEQGVAMLSSVLNSKRAIHVNIQIMRAFTKFREFLVNHHDLQRKIDRLERKFSKKFAVVFKAIQLLLNRPAREVKGEGLW